MMRLSKTAFAGFLVCLLAGGLLAQETKQGADQTDRAAAYYNFSMGHLYAELASMYGNRGEHVDRAIQHYKAAIKADPSATFLAQELADIYIQAGRLREAVLEAEDMLKRDPSSVEGHRILGRIYTRMIGDSNQNRVDENMLRRATEQFQKITEKDPKDVDAWITLGRLHKMGQNSVEAERAYKQALELDPNNEYALSGLALVYSDAGDTKTALQMWQRLSTQSPNPRVLRALAAAYEQERDYAGAAQTLRRALDMAPQDPEIKRDLAETLILSGEFEESLKLYTELAQSNPKEPLIQLRISQIHRQKGDLAGARAAQERAKALDAKNLEVRYNDVNLLEAEGKFAEAIESLKGLLDSTRRVSYAPPERSNRAILLERLGLLYRANDQVAESVAAFEEVAQLDRDLGGRAQAQIIETYRSARQFDRAAEQAETAVKNYPENRTVKQMRASVLADIGRYDDAIAGMKSLFDGKNDRETWLALAQIYEKAKKYTEMANALDQADKLSNSPGEKETVLFMRGAMYERQKKYDEAEAEFRKVIVMNPRNASALNYLGYMFADRGVKLEEAHDLIRKALELDPQNGAFLDSLGWVYYRQGKLDEAEENLRLALARVPRDPTIYDHLGDVLYAKGRWKDAIIQWQNSLQEWEKSPQPEINPAEIAKVQKKLENAKVRLAKESSKLPGQN